MPFKLSPSSIKLFVECTRCFWLTQHKVWKRPSGAFPSLPAGMDKIIKFHFNSFRDKGLLPPELCSNKHCEDIKLFNDKDLLKLWQNNRKGISPIDKNGNILYCAVDDLLIKEDKIIVLDFKTRGYAVKEDTAEMYQLQLDIYNFLLRKNNYKTENYAFLLFYMPQKINEDGSIIFDTELVKRDININNAENVFNNAIKLLNNDCPKKSCEWCDGK